MRREKDEFRITELKTQMTKLDGELTAEVKRRTEMNKSTQLVSPLLPLSALHSDMHYSGLKTSCLI